VRFRTIFFLGCQPPAASRRRRRRGPDVAAKVRITSGGGAKWLRDPSHVKSTLKREFVGAATGFDRLC
jgi:hypothetical protein